MRARSNWNSHCRYILLRSPDMYMPRRNCFVCTVFDRAYTAVRWHHVFVPTNLRQASKSFNYQQMHFVSASQIIKIYIKTCNKTAPTCFGLRPSSGSLHLSLAKVTFIKQPLTIRRYGVRGGVAACYVKSMEVCAMIYEADTKCICW